MKSSWRAALPVIVLFTLETVQAQAGFAECGNIRLEDVGNCELRADIKCSAGCEEIGIYKKACATKLHTVCRSECSLAPNATCTDECTEQCSADCDLGVNVICIHNCFGECVGACDASCENADDEQQCQATCEANCDGECDIKCKPLVDGSCYEHCIECCGGSCTAQANMDCQTTCQEEEFETCETEFRADCDASCEGDGALFCDGEFILAGKDLPECAAKLVAEGSLRLDASVATKLGVDDLVKEEPEGSISAGCAVSGPRRGTGIGLMFGLVVALAVGIRRRFERPRRKAKLDELAPRLPKNKTL